MDQPAIKLLSTPILSRMEKAFIVYIACLREQLNQELELDECEIILKTIMVELGKR
jgi:hypothetical protein